MTIDITNGLQDAINFINPVLFSTQSAYTVGCLNLAAHFLVISLRSAGQGISGQWPWMVTSKGVGSVSYGMTIPQEILDNPQLAMLTTTYYGAKYILFVYPFLKGNAMSL